jgi:hypothetical protein
MSVTSIRRTAQPVADDTEQEPVNWKELSDVYGEIIDHLCDSLWGLLYGRQDWNSPDEVVEHVRTRINQLENENSEMNSIVQEQDQVLKHTAELLGTTLRVSAENEPRKTVLGFYDQHGNFITQQG